MDLQKINKAAGEVLSGMDNNLLTLDEKIAVLSAAKFLIESTQSAEMAIEMRKRVLDSIYKKPVGYASQKH